MPLNVSLQNQLATKMAHNTTEWWEEFFRWKSLETQNIASILTCFVSWGFFWLEQTWNRGMYKQIQNCDQFASSKQYVVVMHYLKKNVCMEKKSDRFHRRDKIGFLNSVKIGTEELWQQTKEIFWMKIQFSYIQDFFQILCCYISCSTQCLKMDQYFCSTLYVLQFSMLNFWPFTI